MTDTGPQRHAFARLPVGVVAFAVMAVLLMTASRYGYHRDELYFRVLGRHPAWGYVDQPPATPLLTRASIALFGDTVRGLRVPAILAAGAVAYLCALVARETGGGPGAQTLAAAASSGTLVLTFGHLFVTTSLDMVVWLAVALFVLRALLHDRPRWWLAVGAVVGVGLYNKLLVLLLLAALAAGLLAVGPRRVLFSRWPWTGMGLAALIGAPNLVYQVTHHFPVLTMAGALRTDKGALGGVLNIPFLFLTVGLPLSYIAVAGLFRVLRDPVLRPVRALGAGYLLLLVLLCAVAAQPYYAMGLVLTLHAVGSVPVARALAERRHSRVLFALLLGLNLATSVAFTLPVLSLHSQQSLRLADANQGLGDEIGWPRYVSQIAAVYRPGAIIITGNYGEYGALDRYGAAYGIPSQALYSGQNALRNLGTPPDSARTAVVVGYDDRAWLSAQFADCRIEGRLDSRYRIDGEEQQRAVYLCHAPVKPWHTLWHRFLHYD
ncbi:glycosyltransferase family 39 protein [Streptomyces sp. NPDC001833]|uniref:glycosyltransferase family 39 protein n=1 Tax=Streptomyces sp. NPDC001833 TaxID=3154658 RepID=UPI003325E609